MLITLEGRWKLDLRRGQRILWSQRGKNLITSAGLLVAAKRIGGVAEDPIGYAAIGAGTTAPSMSQTALQGTEHERVATSNSAAGDELTVEASFGTGIVGTASCAEIGLFNASSSGDMFSRFIFTAFSMDNTMTLDLTWVLGLE